MANQLISIIVPCYNQAEFLDESLKSVIDQDQGQWECIIVNDGSTDETAEVAQSWCDRDERFAYIYQENRGLSEARNTGIRNASGQFILPLDADDRISPDYARLAMEVLIADTEIKIVYCKAEFFGDKSGEWQLAPYSFERLLRLNMIFCSAVYRKAQWQTVGGYDPNMKYGLEDWEFWINVLKSGGKVKRLDVIGFYYRVKRESMIKSMSNEQTKYSEDYVLQKHKEAYLQAIDDLLLKERILRSKLRSRKHIMHLFFKRFFGIELLND